jgi:hypothetical protein
MKSATFVDLLSVALLRLADKEQLKDACWLTEKPETLHGTFQALKEKYEAAFPPLRDLHFVTRGAFPYSYELSSGLELLQDANAIRRNNPRYDKFAPTWFYDTHDFVEEKLDFLLEGPDEKALFDQFVDELKTLRLSS